MGLAILALFLLAWAIVLGGPMLGRYLRSREGRAADPFGDPFAALGRSVERSGELDPQRPRRHRRDASPDLGPDVPTAPIPPVDVPLEPRVVSIDGTDAPVPAEVRRRRAILALVGLAAVVLLLAIATGSVLLWVLQLLVDAVFVAYTVALVRHAHLKPGADAPSAAPEPAASFGGRALGDETIRELLVRSRRFVIPAVAVVAVGAIVFGGVVLAGGGDDHANDRAGAVVDDSTGSGTPTSDTVRAPRSSTTDALPAGTVAPPTTAAATPVTSPAATRPTFPARTLPPVTTAAPVVPALAPQPPPDTQPPPVATQPPNLLCVLLHAFC